MLNRLIRDIRRSALFHVLAIFLASGWAVLQIIDALIDNGVLPAWTFKGGLVMLLLGLPVVLATAYVQGMRASEERRTATAVDPAPADADVARPATTAAPAPPAAAQHVFTWWNALLGCGSFVDYAKARTYDEMNQPAAAIAAYEQALARFDPATLIDDTFDIARALRRLGELYDAQGNTAKAVEYYARFVNLWRDADPELQPIVRRVQDRLQLLVANRG